MPVPDPRVDELRQRLRSLGYLDAGVDRFLLGPARETGSPLALGARAAIRVGLLGGVLLGPAAALGVGARLPGLISGGRDALVVAVYLALFFFVAVAAASFALSAIGAGVLRARRGAQRTIERLSRGAGVVLTLAVLAYLTLWWRNANAGFGWSAPVWTAFALVVAVAISLLLGHAQRITTLAVLAAAAGPSAQLPAITNRSWRVVLAGGAVAFACSAALLVSTAAAEPQSGVDRPSLSVVSTGRSLRVVAVDGFDPAMAEMLIGRLPYEGGTLAPNRVGDRPAVVGARYRLQAQDTSDPARAWTTVATGEPPDVHGVLGIETRRVAGVQGTVTAGGGTVRRVVAAATDLVRLTRPSVASRDERRSKTFWEVAEEAGLRTAVVNWWATWPAPQGAGIVITDRAVLRLEHGGALDAEIAPAALYESLRTQWSSIRQHASNITPRFSGVPDPAVAAALRRTAELDATIVAITLAMPGPTRDLDVVYLPGLDIAQHTLFATSEAGALPPTTVAARVDALREYYGFLRTAVSILAPSDRMDVMILTPPGRVTAPADGLLWILGPSGSNKPAGIRTGLTAHVEDIAPTILHALGVPLSSELPGHPLTGLPSLDRSPRYVSGYGRPFVTPSVREGKPLDQEMIDRLRSLGYVK